jgi:4-hydroxy-tetrahydrodipicolinate reductase
MVDLSFEFWVSGSEFGVRSFDELEAEGIAVTENQKLETRNAKPETIKVIVCGALGRTGRAVVNGLANERELDLAGGVAPHATEEYLALPEGGGLIPLARDTETLIKRVRPRVLVDFTRPEAAMDNARLGFQYGVSPVVGTSGIAAKDVEELARLAEISEVGAVLAPNFAVGAALAMHFARIASRFFSASEIIELHHDGKLDAPSGSALATARAMREARGADFHDPLTKTFTVDGVRGGEVGGTRLHSVRLPGLVAHQEIIFGGPGQLLTIRHDSTSRDSFVGGVVLACRAVINAKGLVYGLDKLMGLGDAS